jgi:uncharacterized protein YjbI with pentapeptide repeats
MKRQTEQHGQTEREISINREQKNILQAYYDKITELMIARNSDTLKDKQFWAIATEYTHTVLPDLNGIRKAELLRFLYRADLINNDEIGDPEKQRTSRSFNLENIRKLLIEGFTSNELRRLCYDKPQFRSVYDKFSEGMGKDRVIDILIEYAEQKDLIKPLLVIVKEYNPTRYESNEPYIVTYNSTTFTGTRIQPQKARIDLDSADLCKADLLGANLEGADLSGAYLGEAKLRRACLNGANLEGILLFKGDDEMRVGTWGNEASRKKIFLRGAHLNKANLKGAELFAAELNSADLREATLNKANLDHANLCYAKLLKATLNEASLVGADLKKAKLSQANLENANLSNANLEEADLSQANLSNATLSNADLSGADLSDADLSKTILEEADLGHAKLIRANLSEAILKYANLEGAKLNEAILSGAYLEKANLGQADLENVNLSEAKLGGTNLERANLIGATLKGAQYNKATKWPSNFNPKVAEAIEMEDHLENELKSILEYIRLSKER